MLPPFQRQPQRGGKISAEDLSMVFEMAYRAANISATTPIHVDQGPGGPSIWLDSELPDISYINVTDKFVFAGDNIATLHLCRLYDAQLYIEQPYSRVANRITRTASGPWTAIDGVTPVIGDRILLNNPGGDPDNGIWEVSGMGQAPGTKATMDRCVDANINNNFRPGMLVAISPDSKSQSNWIWQLVTPLPITLGTTPLTFTRVTGGTDWVVRTTNYTGWNFTWGTFDFTGTLVGTPITLSGSALNGLNWQPGDTISFSDGTGDTITGTVTSYTPAAPPANASLTFTVTGVTGTGVHTGVTGTATATSGLYPGQLYDRDLNLVQTILVRDTNGNKPTAGVYYIALRGSDQNGTQLWRTNVSGPVMLGCVNGQGVFGPAL